jgi:amino acid adenylation domain-containing protein
MQEHLSNPHTEIDLTNVSAAKRALLEKYFNGEIDDEFSPGAIARRDQDAESQLSFSQERLWFLDQLMPGSPVFNVPTAVRLTRQIDTEVLRKCVNEIVERHEVFRTTFITVEGQPVPIVSPSLEVELSVISLASANKTERETESQRLVSGEAIRPFDLTRGPLIRTSLIKIGESESIFVLNMHHIVSDGWSILIFFKELTALYSAFSRGQSSPLAALPIQYADYAAWQRDALQIKSQSQQLAYWKNQLAGELPVLDLPADRTRPPLQTYSGERATLTLSEELTQALTALSRREGATLFMTLLAAFTVLLQRYTRQEEIIVGSPVVNRPRAETEKLIGFFLNNLALRNDLSGDPSFRELLSRVRLTAVDAFANQDVPFEKLIEELRPERDLSRTSIFQVYFNLFSFSDKIELPDGQSISFVDAWLQSDEHLSKFDLTLYAGADENEIKLAMVFNTDLFDRERIEEMLEQLKCLLSQIVQQPDEKICNFSLVTDRARFVLPNPAQPFPNSHHESIQSLFSRQAKQLPSQTAIIDESESWTYREADARSNQLANYLRAHGVRTGDVVAIYGHRSAPLVWAIMGVLKAGAAFTIVDPAYPVARSITCLEMAAPRGWLQIAAAGPLPEALNECANSLGCCRMLLSARGAGDDPLAQYSTANPEVETGADDLAYIAFTSGSTGNPKGVLGRHGPLTLFTSWAAKNFGLDETDRFSLLSGLAHDPLHRDIFTPLQLGGTICIPDPAVMEQPGQLRAWIEQQRITVANLTPAMSQLLTGPDVDGRDDRIKSLRYSFLVGDVLTKRDVARLRNLAPSIACVNLYGSTETQRAVAHYVVTETAESDRGAKDILPLGKGIKDVQLLVLNSARKLCGIGEVGEIYFRSPHLAKGYLGDDQLTRERFISNPFTDANDDRLYRTGDLGRYRTDGNVEHVGRFDRQVKIRGFRIEPAEIEKALAQYAGVREAAVVPLQNEIGETILAAYVVPTQNATIATPELRRYLSEKLPAYMVPVTFVMLAALPLTPNGKLDRRALPAPDQSHRDQAEYSAPQSATEKTLAHIWEEVLKVAPIGVHDNFFELGGHSLLAVRLFAAIERKFGQRLPLAALFQAPTIGQLAASLEKETRTSWSSLVPVQPHGSRRPFFCVHAVGGNVLEYYDLARRLDADQPFYALQSRGLDETQAPHTRIEDMAAHYLKEIRQIQPEGPYLIGGRSLGGIIAYEMACQFRSQGDEIALLALLDSYPVGYNKLAAQAGSLKRRAARTIRRMQTHFENVRDLSFSNKFSYVVSKAGFAALKLKSKLWRTVYRSYEGLGRDLPSALRNVEEFNWLAAHNYVPRPYDGKVTLFWANQDLRASYDLIAGWRVLAKAGLEIREIPGTHLDIIKEPHVGELAKCLTETLVRAQDIRETVRRTCHRDTEQ